MTHYTYKVVPAPAKGRKAPGVKGAEARFAHGLEAVMNEMAAEGWEYLRADILPSEERQGLTSTQTVYRSVLVFRREAQAARVNRPDAPTVPAPVVPPPHEPEEPGETPREVPEETPVEIPREERSPEDPAPSFRRRTPPPLTATRGARLSVVDTPAAEAEDAGGPDSATEAEDPSDTHFEERLATAEDPTEDVPEPHDDTPETPEPDEDTPKA
ncbi:MAG: DUF4177 domain-containing protein [Roseovarius sp.]